MDQFVYFLPLALAAAVSLGVSAYTWHHHHLSGASIYTWVTLGQAITTIAYMLELGADTLEQSLFWDNVQWLTLSVVGASLVTFSLQFAGRPGYRSGRIWRALMLFPAVFMVLVVTNPWHHLTTGADVHLVEAPPFRVLDYSLTPLGLTMGIYLMGMGMASVLILLLQLRRTQPAYRKQLVTVVIGIIIPLIGGMISTLEIMPGPIDDIDPYAFAISNVVIVWGLVRYRLFEVAPIARHAVVESMSDALIVIDLQNRIVDVNQAAQNLIHRIKPNKPVIGTLCDVIFADWREKTEHYKNEYAPFDTEIALGEPPDQQFFAVSVAPVIVSGTMIGGRSILLKEITERKRTEIMLQEQTRALEIAKQEAEAADRLKSQFLASVSHELRTPMNAIINFTQFVAIGLYGPVTPEQVDALDKSTNSARHLLALINDVLDMSKIEAGRLELLIEGDTNIQPEIDEVVATVQTLLAGRPVTLAVDFAGTLPPVSVDRRRFRQVLLNLLTNAAKFTESGSITLRIEQQPQHLLFAVADTGCGIPEHEQVIIFESFRQAKRNGGHTPGTGLGLPISRRLVEEHGGTLWLESVAGEGSTFYFTLPLTTNQRSQ